MSFIEYASRYYCEVEIPLPKDFGFSRSFDTYEEFDTESEAINYFLSRHSRRVNRIYGRRARVVYNVMLHAYEREWISVPIYTRID